jgi:toxin YoeB
MSAAKRRSAATDPRPASEGAERKAVIDRDFRQDLVWWIGSDPRVALRVMWLIEEVIRDPFKGAGKPELLKYDLQGRWSRRITNEHRLVYEVTQSAILFMLARFHYRG